MKYYISGANGFVGQNLIKRLNGHLIYVHAREQSLSAIKHIKPDVIFHLAAELHKDDEMFNSNVKLTYDLLEASREIDYQAFICVGSSSEYGRKPFPIKEFDSLVPDTMYEATKGASSLLCQAFSKMYNKPITIARPFSLYGPHEKSNRFIPTMINCWKTKQPLYLSQGVHDWIYIDDFIDGLMLLADKKLKTTVNFGTGIQTSNAEVVKTFEEITGDKLNVIPIEKLRSYDSNWWVCDTSYAKTLGFEYKYDLKEGLKKCMEFSAKT